MLFQSHLHYCDHDRGAIERQMTVSGSNALGLELAWITVSHRFLCRPAKVKVSMRHATATQDEDTHEKSAHNHIDVF